MNITPQHTTVADNTQEVLLRTLASDVASLEHGSQTPTAEHLTARFTPPAENTSSPDGHHSSAVHIVLVVVFLLVIAAVIYFFVYPHLRGGVVSFTQTIAEGLS